MDEGIRFVRSGDQTFYLQGDLKAVKKFRENDTEVQSVCQKILLGSNDLTVPKGVIVTKYEARKFSPQATVSKELLVAPQQSTLFSKIIHLFHRFREFVTGREAKKEERRAAEFRLAQTIFGTEDDALLADLFPSTVQKTRQREVSDIPLSKMLKAWVDAMDSPESPSEKIPALRNLIIYQESLEAIQQISSHRKRAEARTQLNQRIYRDMASHKGPIFVPGGFFDPEKGRVVPIIYELTRDPKGVRAIDVCGESISAMDEPLPQEEPRGIHEDLLKLAGEKQPKKETRTQAGETQIQLQETDSLEDFVNQATLLATGTSAQGAHSSKPSMMGKLLILYAPAIERRLYGVDEWTIEQERISAVTFALECAKGAQKMLTKLKNASESYKTDAHISNFKNNFIICVSNARAALPRALPSTVEGKKMAQEAKKIIETILSEAPVVFGKVSIPKGQSFRAEPSDETQKKHAIKVLTSGTSSPSMGKLRKQARPAETVRTFLQAIEPDRYQHTKEILRAQTLLSIWNSSKATHMIEDPHFRSWCAANAQKLLARLGEENPSLNADLETICQSIKEYDEAQLLPLPDAIPLQRSFTDPLRPALPFVSLESVKASSVQPLPEGTLIDVGELVQKGNINEMKAYCQKLKKLATTKEFSLLHFHLTNAFQSLSHCDPTAIAKGSDYEEWLTAFKELAFLLPRASFGVQQLSPTPEDIKFYLTSLKLQDQMARAKYTPGEDPFVDHFHLDMAPVRMMLSNPYCTLGEQAQELEELLKYFEQQEGTPFRGIHVDSAFAELQLSQTALQGFKNDFKLYNSYNSLGEPSQLARNFSSEGHTLPSHVQSMRQSYIVFEAFLSPTRTFVPCSKGDVCGIGEQVLDTVEGGSHEEMQKAAEKMVFTTGVQQVDQHIISRQGEISFSCQDTLIGRTAVVVEPWKMMVLDIDDEFSSPAFGSRFDFAHKGHFDAQGVLLRDPTLRERCFEQVVAEESGMASDSGIPVHSKFLYQAHSMKGVTEWQIHQDQTRVMGLNLMTSHQLQLMNTEPYLINGLTVLSQSIALLDNALYGPAVARLMSRNIFRNGAWAKASSDERQLVVDTLADKIREAELSGNIQATVALLGIAREAFANSKTVMPKVDTTALMKKFKGCSNKEFLKLADTKGIRRELAVELLLGAKEGMVEFSTSRQFATAFIWKSSPKNTSSFDAGKEAQLAEWYLKLIGTTTLTDSEKQEMCGEVFVAKFGTTKTISSPWVQDEKNPLVYRNALFTIDLSRCEIWEDGASTDLLPPLVVHSDIFADIGRFIHQSEPSVDLLATSWKTTLVSLPSGKKGEPPIEARQYEASFQGTVFKIIVSSDSSIRLFRKTRNEKEWYQYQTSVFSGVRALGASAKQGSSDILPRTIGNGDCWISDDGKKLSVENNGETTWQAQLSGPQTLQILSLERNRTQQVLNPHTDRACTRFLDMEDGAHIVALGAKNSLARVEYTRFGAPFSYELDSDGKWRWGRDKEYYLSEKSLEALAAPQAASDETSVNPSAQATLSGLQKLFHPSFTSYHLLQSIDGSGHSKLLLPGVEYQQTKTHSGKDVAYRFNPKWQRETKKEIPLYEFDIDPIREGLIPQKIPEGYLFLAYTLCVQGNFNDAFMYLDKANFHRELSEDGKEVFSWLQKYTKKLPLDSPERLCMEARLFLIEPSALNSPVAPDSLAGQKRALQAKFLLDNLEASDEKISPEMRVTATEKQSLQQISHQSLLSVIDHIKGNTERTKLLNNIQMLFPILFPELPQGMAVEEKRKVLGTLINDLPPTIISVSEKATLIEFVNSHGCDNDSIDLLDTIHLLSQIQIWKTFSEEILTPFSIGLRELYQLKESGIFTELDKETVDMSALLKKLDSHSHLRRSFALRSQISELTKKLKSSPTRAPTDTLFSKSTPLFSETEKNEWQEPVPASDPHPSTHPSPPLEEIKEGPVPTKELRAFIRTPPIANDTYAQKLEKDIREDILTYASTSSDFPVEAQAKLSGKPISPKALSLHVMQDPRKKIEMALQQKMTEIAESRKECMEILRPSRAAPTLAQRIGRVGRADSQALFETAIRCFGEGSWDRLLQQGISENAIKDLSDHVRSFLKASIQAKQLENAGEISHDLTSVPPPSFEEAEKILGKISSLLNAEWQYDVDHDIHAPTILLIEYELGFICRKSQLDVVSENLTKNNRFKQEICGGGKTTVLRNIISQARADGKTMSGVSTLDPLRSEHGLLYARTTKNAFGEEVFDFHFNRASPSDENSLLDLHKQFLEITVNRGRVDLCRGDLQSFKLAMHLKNESIAEKRREYAERIQENPLDAKAPGILEDITRIHRELDVMEDIRDFLIEHASIMADELDKDCDPTQEKNYAYGESSSLDSAKRTAACTLLRTLFESSDRRLTVIRKALLQNEQARLSREDPQQIVDGLKALAENVWDESYRAFGFASKEEFASYLTDPEHSERIFESVFKKYSIPPLNASPLPHQLENIAFLRKYLSDIVPNAMKKTGGVSYGRSQKDKTLVIPYRDSDAPKEGSLHGNDMERIWYTSVDYVQAGISAEQARAEWIEANDKALKELLAANRAKIEMTKDQTVSATQFKKKYGIAGSFSSLTEKDVDAMRTALKERPIQMVAFLEENVLPSLRQNTEKIVSDAQDPPSMVKSYSGSSGTDTGAMALPDKIDIINARQEGVHGKTWERMLESDTRLAGQSFMPTLDQQNQYGGLAEMMKGGDCLSDVGRLFPGIPSKQIAKELSSIIAPDKNVEYIVFMDPNDCWKMLRTSDGKEVDYIPTKNREQLLRRITLFDPAHTRGAERDSTSGVTEYVTIDVDTDLSRFEQAVARERNVLAGTANVKYILTPGLVTKMTNMGGCTIGNLLAVVSENEANQLKILNYKAECQKIKHILKDAGETALRALSRKCRAFDASQHHELRERTHSALRHLFFASSTMDAHEAAHPSGEQSTESALDGLVLHQLKIARDIQDEMRAKELTSYSAPLVFKDVKDSLQQINEGITSVLRAQHEFSSVIATFKTSAEASQWPFMAKVKEAAIKADAQVNSPEINEKIAVVRKKQAELQRLLQSEKTFEGLSEELRLDLSSQIRKTAAQAREELESILREITTQQMRIDSAITEISPEKNAPKPTDLLGHLTAAVKKAAVKVVERYANWRTEGGVDKIQGALKSLSDEIRKLLETTKTLESKTSPLVSLAQEALSEAVPLLLAKLSPKQQQIELEKFPEADREKIKAAIRTAKGRVPLEFLPKMVRGSTADQDKEAEVETEQEQEVEEEQELETEEGKTLLGKEYQHQRLSWPSDINAKTEPLSAHSAIRLENKRFTQNCYPIKKSDGKIAPWTIGVDGKSVLPEEHKLIERSIFIVKDQQLTEVYGSQLDLRDVANQNPENVCIYNYVLGKVDFGENPLPDLHEQFMQHIVTTKLFRGDVEFSETEQPFLRSYVMSLSPAEKKSLKEALPQVIAKYRPDMTYTGSSLKKLLENMGL